MTWWQRLGGSNAVTLPAWLLTLPGAVLTPGLTAARAGQPLSPLWLLLGALGHCLFGLLMWLAWRTVLQPADRPTRPAAYALVVIAAGVVRGAFISVAAIALGISANPDWFVRLASAPATLLVWYSLAALLVDGTRRHREAMQTMRAQVDARHHMAESSVDEIRYQQDATLSRIENIVTGQLQMALEMSAAPDEAARELHRIVDRVVRPLSREMETQASAGRSLLKSVEWPGRHGRPPLRSYIQNAFVAKPFAPLLSSIIVVGTSFILTLASFGVVRGSLCLALQGSTFALASRVAQRWHAMQAAAVQWGFVALGWILIALLDAVALAVVLQSLDPARTSDELTEWIAVTVVWFVLGLMAQVAAAVNGAVTALRERAEAELASAGTAIAWAEARLRQRAWTNHRQLSRVLHGEVQSRIVSSALQLQLHPPADPSSVIERLSSEIQLALRSRSVTSWSEALTQLRALWDSAIDLRIDVAGAAAERLEADPDGASAVIEVLREAVTNAVRHGDADTVIVRIDSVGSWITLDITDDGSGVPRDARPGLGSQLYDALCVDWSLDGVAGAHFQGRVATAPERTASGTERIWATQ